MITTAPGFKSRMQMKTRGLGPKGKADRLGACLEAVVKQGDDVPPGDVGLGPLLLLE